MKAKTNDRRALTFLIVAFGTTMLWGYLNGDFQKLFKHRSLEEKSATEQRALNHIFGSDQAFDPAADNMTTEAEGKRDTVSWRTLAHAKLNIGKASDSVLASVDFAPELQELNDHDITLTGYIFPLEAASDQGHFLLSAYPPSCPYCLPGGPTELVEITDSKPIKFTYEPVTIHGRFQLLKGEALKEGMFYRMTQIRLSER